MSHVVRDWNRRYWGKVRITDRQTDREIREKVQMGMQVCANIHTFPSSELTETRSSDLSRNKQT